MAILRKVSVVTLAFVVASMLFDVQRAFAANRTLDAGQTLSFPVGGMMGRCPGIKKSSDSGAHGGGCDATNVSHIAINAAMAVVPGTVTQTAWVLAGAFDVPAVKDGSNTLSITVSANPSSWDGRLIGYGTKNDHVYHYWQLRLMQATGDPGKLDDDRVVLAQTIHEMDLECAPLVVCERTDKGAGGANVAGLITRGATYYVMYEGVCEVRAELAANLGCTYSPEEFGSAKVDHFIAAGDVTVTTADDVPALIRRVESRAQNIQATADTIARSLSDAQTALSGLTARLGTLHDDVGRVHSDVQNAAKEIAGIRGMVNALQSAVGELAGNLRLTYDAVAFERRPQRRSLRPTPSRTRRSPSRRQPTLRTRRWDAPSRSRMSSSASPIRSEATPSQSSSA